MRHIPNFITLLNLLSGAIGVVAALSGFWYLAFWLLIAAAVFDFFDGFAARLLKVSSELGKQLDSLADLISFGFLPSAMMYRMFYSSPNLPPDSFQHFLPLLPFVSFLILAASALRLAKFNIDTRQTYYFIGLPTPANALLIGGLTLIFHFVCHCTPLGKFVGDYRFLLVMVAFSSIMPLVNLPMLSLKFKNLKFKDNIWRFLLLVGVLSIALIFINHIYMSVSLSVLYYILLSIIWAISLRFKVNNI